MRRARRRPPLRWQLAPAAGREPSPRGSRLRAGLRRDRGNGRSPADLRHGQAAPPSGSTGPRCGRCRETARQRGPKRRRVAALTAPPGPPRRPHGAWPRSRRRSARQRSTRSVRGRRAGRGSAARDRRRTRPSPMPRRVGDGPARPQPHRANAPGERMQNPPAGAHDAERRSGRAPAGRRRREPRAWPGSARSDRAAPRPRTPEAWVPRFPRLRR